MLKGLKYTLILLAIVAVSACSKKKWDKTAEVEVYMEVEGIDTNVPPTPGTFQMTGTQVKIAFMELAGDRKQADDILLTSSDNLNFNFNDNESAGLDMFDVPQGTYTDLRLSMRLGNNDNDPSLRLNGIYTDANNITAQVKFTMRDVEWLDIRATDSDGSHEIIVIEGQSRILSMNLNVDIWLVDILPALLENADHVGGPNSPIFIDDQNNVSLFNLIVNRLEEGITLGF